VGGNWRKTRGVSLDALNNASIGAQLSKTPHRGGARSVTAKAVQIADAAGGHQALVRSAAPFRSNPHCRHR